MFLFENHIILFYLWSKFCIIEVASNAIKGGRSNGIK